MTQLSFEQFRQQSIKGTHIAVTQTLPCDLETPVSCFLKLADREESAFLLESAEQEEKIGRYSLIGFAPAETIRLQGGKIIHRKKSVESILPASTDLTTFVESRLRSVRMANPEVLPDFCGGWVGYLGYENVASFETIKLRPKPGLNMPDSLFFLVNEFVVFDHFRKTLTFAAIVPAQSSRPLQKKNYQLAVQRLNRLSARLRKPLNLRRSPKSAPHAAFISNLTKSQFVQKVQKIKKYVMAGDCIQVVLSQRFKIPAVKNDFQIYRALRSINPSPHMFYFRSGNLRLIGSSPELLVKKQGDIAEVRPIAGTRPRGRTANEDQRLELQLKKSKKEMAEHLMLVDLGRNDLGRVCRYKTVSVSNFAHVERFSHVMHLVSDVKGRLKAGCSAFDLLRATFPAGTVTGAPKIRAMQIIDEQEPERRGPYAGCLGYFSFNHNMEMCLTIRTLVQDGKNLYLQAGAGIVQDSKPEMEYQETVNKALALVRAVQQRGVFECY